MKKLYTLFALLFVASMSYAQLVELTVSVDMNNQVVSPNGLYLAGDLQSAAGGSPWTPGDPAFEMTDPDGNGVYSLTISVVPGNYQYKYVNDNMWGVNEGSGLSEDCGVGDGYGAFNRGIEVPDEESYTEPTYIYDSCELSTLPINSVAEAVSSIEGITVSPNPFNEIAYVTFDNPANVAHRVTITTMTGQVVWAQDDVRDAFQVEKGSLPTGLYLMTFQNEAGEIGAEKLMIH
ncbi:MAG: T9SS type A sorting domain-containing protein [Bacteroidota bacterium]